MIRVFISYSHVDESYRNELDKHLKSLQRQEIVEVWHDRRIMSGEEWADSIDTQLNQSDIILLLISSDFIASNYCYDIEMKFAISRHESGESTIIPVILRPCDWTDLPFGRFQAATKDGKPVIKYPSFDDAFLEITQNIKAVSKKIINERKDSNKNKIKLAVTNNNEVANLDYKTPIFPRSSNLALPKFFSDHDKDTFISEAFDYIALFFEGSLSELKKRNTGISTQFQKIDTRSFEAVIYINGRQVSSCGIWIGNWDGSRGASSIFYSNSGIGNKNSFSYNESISVEDDGNLLGLKPMNIQGQLKSEKTLLTNEGAAEYYWSIFFESAQRMVY
ncbi:MAG: toll/interleukin-1 receptor domain-containing protein [Candidatus Competibacter sp.]